MLLLAGSAAYLTLACAPPRAAALAQAGDAGPERAGSPLAQIGVACADLLCAAGVLYVLLPPQAAIGFAAFAGIVSSSPSPPVS